MSGYLRDDSTGSAAATALPACIISAAVLVVVFMLSMIRANQIACTKAIELKASEEVQKALCTNE